MFTPNTTKKYFKKTYKGFTLVELIVVITILVILGTIAFTSLGSFSSNARDSSRSSDLANLAKGLDITYIKTNSYPTPDNTFSVTYSGGVLWTQGTISDGVMNVIAASLGTKLSKKPTDPLVSTKEYTYSKLGQGNAYQIKTDWEGDSIAYISPYNSLSIDQVYSAAANPTISYIKGNYNNLVAKTQTGSSICLLALPSIISNTGSSATPTIALETTNLLSGSLLTSGGNLSGTPFKSSLTGSTTPVVYCSGALPTTTAEKTLFASGLANAYSGTTLATSSVVKPFIAALSSGDTTTLANLGGGVVSSSLGGSTSNLVQDSIVSQDSYTKLLLHFENNITDSSSVPKSVSNNGSVTFGAGKSGFGQTAIFNGGNYLSIPNSLDFDFGTGDFTIDGWVYFNNVSAEKTFIASNHNSGWQFGKYTEGGDGLHLYDSNVSGHYIRVAYTFATSTWYHVAVVRYGSALKFFINGTQIGSDQTPYASGYQSGGNGILLGQYVGSAGVLNGNLDEFRISKGVARWTSNFTVPTSPY